ncbi:MAG: hypothetical protein H7Y11_01145 [Armatimonadetes bacterium]|nr:hypothetical protein [Anaerolineae bacterium]
MMARYVLSWRLWRALNRPPMAHPYFRRLLNEHNRSTWERVRTGLWMVTALLTVILLVVLPVVFFVVLLLAPVIYAMLTTTFYCTLWAMDIAGTVAREQTRRTYELLGLMPVGALGVNWIIGLGRVHYKNGLARSLEDVFATIQLLACILVFALVGVLLSRPGEDQLQLGLFVLMLIALIIGVYADHGQSTLICICVGLIAARQTRTVGDARLWAGLCFVALQVVSYLGLLLTVLLTANALGLSAYSLALPPFTLLLTLIWRELLLRSLWAWALRNLNATECDLHLVAQYAYAPTRSNDG